MKNGILVVGSLVYDEIFSINGKIRKEFLSTGNKVDSLNLMFTAKEKQRYFGGTAGNISYGLALLGENPYVVSPVGEDFNFDYKKYLEDKGVTLKVFQAGPGTFSATFYGISDVDLHQIGIFQPNSYGKFINKYSLLDVLKKDEIRQILVAIFSPGTGKSTRKHITEFRKINKKGLVIFDPGQELSNSYDKNLVLSILRKTDVLIGNEFEIAQFKHLFGMSLEYVLKRGVKTIIETKGDKGVVLHFEGNVKKIDAVMIDNYVEATGAGDAFRSGLIKGLADGKSIEEASFLGVRMGSRAVTIMGGQGYYI